jgi:hypothetical protein
VLCGCTRNDDGSEWFEINHERYFQLIRRPTDEGQRGYIGTEAVQMFSEDGVRRQLRTLTSGSMS